MNLVYAVPLFSATLAWGTFFVWYSLRVKWWKKVMGRHTALVALAFFLVMFRGSLVQFFPELKEVVPLTVVLYLSVAALGVQHIFNLERAQRNIDPNTPHRRSTDV